MINFKQNINKKAIKKTVKIFYYPIFYLDDNFIK